MAADVAMDTLAEELAQWDDASDVREEAARAAVAVAYARMLRHMPTCFAVHRCLTAAAVVRDWQEPPQDAPRPLPRALFAEPLLASTYASTGSTPAELALDELALDESTPAELALDELALDESTPAELALDESTAAELALDELALAEPLYAGGSMRLAARLSDPARAPEQSWLSCRRYSATHLRFEDALDPCITNRTGSTPPESDAAAPSSSDSLSSSSDPLPSDSLPSDSLPSDAAPSSSDPLPSEPVFESATRRLRGGSSPPTDSRLRKRRCRRSRASSQASTSS